MGFYNKSKFLDYNKNNALLSKLEWKKIQFIGLKWENGQDCY